MSKKKKSDKIKVKIEFEDDGQDTLEWIIEYYPDWIIGEVIEADMQSSIWVGMWVLNGKKPAIDGYLMISKSPADPVMKFNHKIKSIEII